MRALRAFAFVSLIGLLAAACGSEVTSDPDGAAQTPAAPSTPPTPVPPDRPPNVDTSRHSVPLDEVYFDTFDGGAVRLSESTQELRQRLLDAIPPIDAPLYGEAAAGDWLEPVDLVLGYVAGGTAYAYPFKILNFHEIVNDEIDGTPVLISYCPLCGSAIVYDRRVGGEVLSFGNTSALYESDLVMVDRTTGSYWWQVAGTAIVGPLTDTELRALPSVVATWQGWVSDHPDTLVLTRDTGFDRPYEVDNFATYSERIDSGRFAFPVGEEARDGRLPASTLVVGVVRNGVVRAYPVAGLDTVVNDVVGGDPLAVIPGDGGVAVFSTVLAGDVVELEIAAGRIVDAATGSEWSTDGVAISGPLAGSVLEALPARTTFWFAFVGAFPDVELSTP